MNPSSRLVYAFGALATLGIALAFGLITQALWHALAGLCALGVIVDAILIRTEQPPRVTREVPGSLALGAPNQVVLHVENSARRWVTAQLHDVHPLALETTGLPLLLELPGASASDWHYTVKPTGRGEHTFGQVHCTVRSPFGFWWRRYDTGEPTNVRVYPNFAAVSRYALMAMEDRLTDIGVRKKRRRGIGSEFQQLREFRQGDSLRQVDWGATARTRKLISKEYQDERDQTVVFLLDCGRRMRAHDDALSHFDEALNAVLLLAYVALHKGDAVGVGTFGGTGRWFAPVKGQTAVSRMLNQLYDLEPTTSTPDYSRAATELLTHQKKRALVIVVTNLRDEDSDDLRLAVQALRKRHSVLIASTREPAVDAMMTQPIRGLTDALRHASARYYRDGRSKYLNGLRAGGVDCLDVAPSELSVELVNTYLAMKAKGAM
jgi:uncharacterized protein (DUF58 family)